jgi:hypothetical protein
MLDGRSDIAQYGRGARALENMIPTTGGALYRRPGTRFVAEAAGTEAPVLVPFVFSREQSYILAFGSDGIYVYSDRGVVESPPGTPYKFGTSGDFIFPYLRRADGTSRISYAQSGDVLYIADAGGSAPFQKIRRLAHDSWTVEVVRFAMPPFQDLPAPGVNAKIKCIPGTADERRLRIPSSVIPVGNTSVLGRRIQLYAEDVKFNSGTNGVNELVREWTVTQQLKPAPITALNEKDFFTVDSRFYFIDKVGMNGDIDGLGSWSTAFTIPERPFHTKGRRVYRSTENAHPIRLTYSGNGYFSGTLAFVVGTGVDYTDYLVLWDEEGIPPEFDSTVWAWEAIDIQEEGGIGSSPGAVRPTAVAFFRERLVLAAGRKVWASVVGDYENFALLDPNGEVVADMGISIEVSMGDGSPISWLASADRLVVGTLGGTYLLGEQTDSEVFGPLNIKLSPVGGSLANGADQVQPVVAGEQIAFISRTGRRLFGMVGKDTGSGDLSAMAEHLGASRFVDLAWQQEPSSVLWVVRQDGLLCGVTLDMASEVVAWHRHPLGGTHAVRSVVCIPSPDGTWTDLWLSVERTIESTGGPSRSFFSIEVLADERQVGTPVEDGVFVDCSLSYDGAPASTFSGLDHLEDALVDVLADGAVTPQRTVIAGAVGTDTPASKVHVGLGYRSLLQTMRVEAGSEGGTAQSQIKRIHRVTCRFLDVVGALVGPSLDKLDRIAFRRPSMLMNQAIPAQTLDAGIPFPSGYDQDGYICVMQDQPLPMTLLSIVAELQTNPR